MIELLIDGITVNVEESEVEEAFRSTRVFTTMDGQIFCISAPDDENPKLAAIGGKPSVAYSHAGARAQNSPFAVGYGAEREWRGFPHVLAEIARRIADEQAVARGTRPSHMQACAAAREPVAA